MPWNFQDLTGQKFFRLTVIERAPNRVTANGNTTIMWKCKCDCGRSLEECTTNLTRGKAKSCGCLRTELHTKHGETNTRLHNIWTNMKQRCQNPNARKYDIYGGRGIKVCDEWQNYIAFMEWAKAHGYSEKLTLDRIDANGNYTPENCRWVDYRVQNRNKKNNRFIEIDGVKKNLADWADEYGINRETLRYRINNGWDIMDALTIQPSYFRTQKNQ